jgi:hypothetical protein
MPAKTGSLAKMVGVSCMQPSAAPKPASGENERFDDDGCEPNCHTDHPARH